ncbi:uterocalin-like isoform X2 [Leopardus geoffroyi]|uniref:uterocalin-like isoform X2 n=1 Tax=Leopardus geoffroyi TaxID=46844 RepID=UPI001E2618C1|nr:uterocalin-like isoform X2 [Leopardus geoffroyi]
MNVLRLALVLTLLGGPQALHRGPQDPNFTENLVSGNWFSIARASNEPKLLRMDSDTMFFIHKIHVTFKTMQFHVHRRVKGRCIPIVLTASKTRRKSQYVLKYAGHSTIFMEKADPQRFVIFCIHNRRHRKKAVMVDLLGRTPTAGWDILHTFKSYCQSRGTGPTDIISLTQTGRCLHARP